MPSTYDLEDCADDIEALLQSKFAAAITFIEAEQLAKGKVASGMAAPANNAYYKFAWNDSAMNRNPAIGIFFNNPSAEGFGPVSRQTYTVNVGVFLSATQNDPLATIKLLRYIRAMRKVFEENWGKINGLTREKLETIGPLDFTLDIDSSDECKIAGVSLTLTLG